MISGSERSPGGVGATHSSILAWRIPWAGGAWQATVHGFTELDMTEMTEYTHVILFNLIETSQKMLVIYQASISTWQEY